MRFRDLPIDRKLFFVILPICLVPAILFLALIGWGSKASFERAMGEELARAANQHAERFDRFVQYRMVMLSRLTLENLRVREVTGFRAPGENFTRSLSWLDAAHSVGADGRVESFALGPQLGTEPVEADDRAPSPPLPIPRDQVQYWLARRESVPPTGLLTDVALRAPGQVEEIPHALFVVNAPDRRLMFYTVRSHRLLREFRENMTTIADFMMIYAAGGELLYSSHPVPLGLYQRVNDPAQLEDDHPVAGGALQASSGWFRLPYEGRAYLMAHALSPAMNLRRQDSGLGSVWVFTLQYDMERVFGPRTALFWLAILIALGLVLLMLWLASLSARWVMSPLHDLRLAADQLAQGQLEARARVASRDEIGALAEAFNAMARRLRATYLTLEERVEENRLRAEHIHLINEMAGAIIQALSLDEIFQILRRELERVLTFDAIWLTRLEQDRLRVTHGSPMGLMSVRERGVLALGYSLHGRVVEGRETLRAEIGPNHKPEFFETRIYNTEGYQSFLIAPLPARNGIIGTLTVASLTPDALGPEAADLLTSLGRTVAIAIEQADLFKQISQFAAELERKVDQRTHELELANQKLVQAEKYFATGRMAGNLAHEINNPLGIIKNYLQIVRSNMHSAEGGRRRTDPNLDSLQVINEEVDRIARLVRQLLDLHRPVEQKIEPVDLNAMIRELSGIVEEECRRGGVEVVLELEEGLPRPIASPDLVRQVLINVIRNAQDAMDGRGGRLTMRTSTASAWERGRERQHVRVRIADTGCGISADHLTQIFDPFFTTKTPDKGTGLGLCVSYSIVRMYQGSIDIESEEGQGTSVVIHLPVDGHPQGEKAGAASLAAGSGGGVA